MPDVKPIPDEYPRVTAYLVVDGASAAIDWYRNVLGMTERMRMEGPGGTIGHAELALGNGVLMLSDEWPDMDMRGPKAIGGTPVTLMMYVEDVDATFAKAVKEGATTLRPVEDQFYGDRSGQFVDPFGHRWNIATHVEDVSPEEMGKRAAQAMEGATG
jgi:PhnB protein